ncbi:MAG: hypothetical protein ACI4TE_00995 [Alphaproteobacteria bacterium]
MTQEYEILTLILKKEADFAAETARLAQNLQSDDLSDYLRGLEDLKSDFLTPLEKRLADNKKAAETAFSNRYRYFERT